MRNSQQAHKKPVHDLVDLQCPDPSKLTSNVRCYLILSQIPTSALCNQKRLRRPQLANVLLAEKTYLVGPKDKTRHNAEFARGIEIDL